MYEWTSARKLPFLLEKEGIQINRVYELLDSLQ